MCVCRITQKFKILFGKKAKMIFRPEILELRFYFRTAQCGSKHFLAQRDYWLGDLDALNKFQAAGGAEASASSGGGMRPWLRGLKQSYIWRVCEI